MISRMRLPLLALATIIATVVIQGCAAEANESDQLFTEAERASFYVPVRDGTRLAMNVYRPAIDGQVVEDPLPTIFVFTPYRARHFDNDGNIAETVDSGELGLRHLLSHGYVVAIADVRGKGASFGRRRGMQDRTEAMDGHDLIEWIARQPWSDGNVGMTGCSYLGGAALQVASTAPPHLKAVVSAASDFDKYDFVRRGGITGQFNTRPDEPLSVDLASVPVDDDPDGELLRQAVAEHADNDPMAALWNTMPYRDSMSQFTGTRFWQEVGPYTYLDALTGSDIAYFLWGNWNDEPTSQIFQAGENLNAHVMVGPGSHCVVPPGVDIGELQLRFFDEHLKGRPTGFSAEPRYRWWVKDADSDDPWVTSKTYPGKDADHVSLYFAGGESGTIASVNDGTLIIEEPEPATQSFEVDYDVATREYFPFWPAVLDEKGLTYTSPPLAEDVTVTGHPVVHLEMSSDQPSGNVFVYLEEVSSDGEAENVAFSRLALWNRATVDPPYDNLGLPWHSGLSTDVLPVEPGERYSLEVALMPTSKVFREGHRIRVSVRGADPRQRNIEEIRRDPPETLSVTLGSESRVVVPVQGAIRFNTDNP